MKSQITRNLPDDQYQAAVNANAATGANPFATMADIPAAAVTLYNGDGTIGSGRVATLTDTLFFTGGTIGISLAPTATDRLSISAGAAFDGAINISAVNVNDNGYGILIQGGTSVANYYGVWSDVTMEGTGTNMAFRGRTLGSGGDNNYGAQFTARNGTLASIGVFGLVSGGDTINSIDSAAVLGINQSIISTDKKGVWGYTVDDVNNGIDYGGNFSAGNSGLNAVNYGVFARANGGGATIVNRAGYFIADGGGGSTNYALITNGGNIGFGTITPSNQALVELVSTTQALLTMRMTAAQASAITPANGMSLYVTNTNGTFTSAGNWYYQEGAWVSSTGTSGVTSVSGTANRITSTGGATPVIDISATFEALLGKVANPLSQFAATTSAQLAGVISDEVGTGFVVFNDSPTFTTQAIIPLIIGGTAAGSFIDHKSTTGVGTTTGLAWRLNGGNNGATNLVNIYNDAQFLVNTTTRIPNALATFRVATGTGAVDIGERSAGVGAIWMGTTATLTPTATNFALSSAVTTTTLNSSTTTIIAVTNSTKIAATTSAITFTTTAVSAGAVQTFVFTRPAHTNQTASTETIGFRINGSAILQHATGALALQREVVIDAPTYSFVGASTITDAVTLGMTGAPIAGANATITNSHGYRVVSVDVSSGGGTVTNSYGITANAMTGATNNYAAQFIGGLGVYLDNINLVLGTGSGTKIGTAITQKLGFYGVTPIVQSPVYTVTNLTTDRTYNANITNIAELADILGTLITDLKSIGLIG